jgi:hypothetical protein
MIERLAALATRDPIPEGASIRPQPSWTSCADYGLWGGASVLRPSGFVLLCIWPQNCPN